MVYKLIPIFIPTTPTALYPRIVGRLVRTRLPLLAAISVLEMVTSRVWDIEFFLRRSSEIRHDYYALVHVIASFAEHRPGYPFLHLLLRGIAQSEIVPIGRLYTRMPHHACHGRDRYADGRGDRAPGMPQILHRNFR